jgi:glutamate dehydrogenase (NAD(P)+)
VGAHAARILRKRLPGVRVTGISDIQGYLYKEEGLPVEKLFQMWAEKGLVIRDYYDQVVAPDTKRLHRTKYSNSPDDLLRESSFCLIPASPVANYLCVDKSTKPSMTVRLMGDWAVIVEGANTYSPVNSRKVARARMEREVYRRKGVLIATDYMVNSGGVIYAAQEHLIRTPEHLRIPREMLGDRGAVDMWLHDHAAELNELAEKRRNSAQIYREEVIRRNMRELVDLLVSDADMLPCEAAEIISIRRIASSESDRTAADIMVHIPTIEVNHNVREAAAMIIEASSSILAVVSPESELVGVVTEWDITRSTALGDLDNIPLDQIMSTNVILAAPSDTILELIRKLEHHEISAMPVVDDGRVLGMVNSDLLARRSLLRLLQSQIER